MINLEMTILYVADVTKTRDFYTSALGMTTTVEMGGYAMLTSKNGARFSLWQTDQVVPATDQIGGSEMVFNVGDDAELDATLAAVTKAGAKTIQDPMQMPFGRTCTVCDLDGHRIRIVVPAEGM